MAHFYCSRQFRGQVWKVTNKKLPNKASKTLETISNDRKHCDERPKFTVGSLFHQRADSINQEAEKYPVGSSKLNES